MYFKKQSKTLHNLLLNSLQEMIQHLKKMLQRVSLIVNNKTTSENSINCLHEEKSIVITEVNLDSEWRSIYGSDKSTPIFLLGANSI